MAEVAAVLSDTQIELSKEFEKDATRLLTGNNAGLSFKVVEHMDQSAVYKAVHDRLNAGQCIGLFPEGGSHDRTEMLPLKAGVTLMALGAMAANPDLDVKIIPCGLHYFHPHQFRSRAMIEFGRPITISSELVAAYKAGEVEGGKQVRRQACSTLLQIIYNGLRSVTVNAPSWEALQVIQAARRLYTAQPTLELNEDQEGDMITSDDQMDANGQVLTMHRKLELTRRFAEGYIKMMDHPEVKRISEQVLEYNRKLKYHGLRDHQVASVASQLLQPGTQSMDLSQYYSHAAKTFAMRLLKLVALALVALPGVVLNLPTAIVADYISAQKAREALKASSVKIAAKDVLATWKLMVALVLVPSLFFMYSCGAAYMSWTTGTLPLPSPWASFLLTWFSLPLISYAAIIFGESSVDIFKSIKPLYMSLSSTNGLK